MKRIVLILLVLMSVSFGTSWIGHFSGEAVVFEQSSSWFKNQFFVTDAGTDTTFVTKTRVSTDSVVGVWFFANDGTDTFRIKMGVDEGAGDVIFDLTKEGGEFQFNSDVVLNDFNLTGANRVSPESLLVAAYARFKTAVVFN